METGKTEEATAALEAAVEACRDGMEPLLLSFGIRQQANRDPKLLKKLSELQSKALKNRSLNEYTILDILASSEETPPDELEKIVPKLKSMVAEDPENPHLLRALARAQIRLKDQDGLRRSLESLVRLEPDPWTHWALARLCQRSEAWSCAEKHLRILAQSDDPLSFLAESRLIQLLSATDRSQEAVEMALKLAQENSDSGKLLKSTLTHTLISSAWLALDSGDNTGAQRLFDEVRRIDPENKIARQAAELIFVDPLQRAENQQRREREMTASEDGDAVLAEGAKLLAAGDASGGWKLLDRGTRLDPESVIGWYNLGIASQRLEKWEDAARAFKHATRLDPDNPVALLGLGRALASTGECSDATAVLEKLTSLHPELYQAQYYLWKCYQSLGRRDAAAEALKKYNANRPQAE